MTNDDHHQKPKERNERREQANRIAAISHRIAEIGPQISAATRELVNQFVSLIKEIQTDSKTTETRDKEYQKLSLRWVKVGTISSIVLSVFSVATSLFALVILHNQLGTMRIDQRAWIKIGGHVVPPMVENKPLTADVVIKNIGKTPAKRIQANYRVQIVKKDGSPDMGFGQNFNSFIGILNPDTPASNNVPMLRDNFDILNPPLLTKSDIATIESGEAYIAVFGRLTYFDIYGISHWVNFCFWDTSKPGTYTARGCVEFNNVDDN